MHGKILPKLLLGLLALGVLGLVCFRQLVRPHPPELDVSRAALVLREGRLYQTGQTVPFTGRMIETFPDGTLQSRSRLAQGVLEGLSEGWHTNGQLAVQEWFHAGRSDGVRVKWYPNGAKLSEAQIVGGKIEGTFRRWYEDGTLAEEIQMRAGQPEGLSRAYYPGGAPKAEAQLRDGRVLERKSWPENEPKKAAGLPSNTVPGRTI